jgi:hypothetical protein
MTEEMKARGAAILQIVLLNPPVKMLPKRDEA